MKNYTPIDCYKLDLIKDIPKELELTIDQRDHLFTKNQKLKKVIWALGISLGCLLVFNIIKSYGKKQKTPQKETRSRQNQTKHQYH